MIPFEKTGAVDRALQDTFGKSSPQSISAITRGLSSDLVFRIVVNDAPYALRVMPRMDEFHNPTRIFESMQMAANAGIAPPVRYANARDGICIIDWVDGVPFLESQAIAQIPALLNRLHRIAAFPKTFNYLTPHKFFIWKLQTAELLPASEVEEAFRAYHRICEVYPKRMEDLVSCHMDLKPENILYDGQKVWLIDWAAAFVNDRYYDLAVAANFLVSSLADEAIFLSHYFGRPADEHEHARFHLMRQVLHMFYAAVFLMLAKSANHDDPAESFESFHRRIWKGEVDLSDNGRKVEYARIHWNQLLRNIRQSQLEESLRIVRRTHAGTSELLLPTHSAFAVR